MTGPADRWVRRMTTGCVAMLAMIAATVFYLRSQRARNTGARSPFTEWWQLPARGPPS